jgi:hypothetical protein
MENERPPRKFNEIIKSGLGDRAQKKFSHIIASGKEFPFDARRKQERIRESIEAFRHVKERFQSVLEPLVESYRRDPRTNGEISRIVPQDELLDTSIIQYKRIEELEKQRQLSRTEKDYFTSTELLSRVGDSLVALARADFIGTSMYLKNHFERLSKATVESLKDGDYFPLTLIGLGPHGLIALGEIVRKNPQLASQMLIVDSEAQPGGPFAIPNGPAWELNSANLRGSRMLPDPPERDEERTIRSYGSPERWYPGERTIRRQDIRAGSINKLIDWLPDSDDLSYGRYPNNEELDLMLSLQASVTAKQLALQTRLLGVEPVAQNRGERGNKLSTLKINTNDDERVVKLRTDSVIVASGLGEPYYGFDIKGKRAERVIEESKKQEGLKKASTTLEAFRSLADRARKKPTPGLGETIAVYGIGDSALTLIEYFGGLFKGENPDIRNIEKIYLIGTGDLSKRPRYARICELLADEGRGNLVTNIKTRVSDFTFDGTMDPIEERKVILFDTSNNPITDENGRVLQVDNLIAATGFKPTLDRVFAPYLRAGERLNDKVVPFTLPTNPKVSVAETLPQDSSVLFVGTASSPRFNEEKLSQLPLGARNELSKVDSGNLVAIGFRGPDTQAAINIFLSSKCLRRVF